MGVLDGCHKIGRTGNPERRVTQVGAKLPAEVRVVHLIESVDPVWIESVLHIAFRHCRARGEWFRLTVEDVAALSAVARVDKPDDLPVTIRRRYDEHLRGVLSESRTGGNRTLGTKQFNVELPTELVDEFRAFCASRDESVSSHTARALRRHMDNPPPVVPDPPLPPTPPLPPVEAKHKRGRKPKA